MKIVTTPMCEKILEFAGISEYKVNKNPDKEEGDLAIILSESKTKIKSLKIKLNTFSQIKNSIIEVSKLNDNKSISTEKNQFSKNINAIFWKYPIANDWLKSDKKKNFRREIRK